MVFVFAKSKVLKLTLARPFEICFMLCGLSAESTTHPTLKKPGITLFWAALLQFDQNCWHICHLMKILSLLLPYKDWRSSAWFSLVKVSNRLKRKCGSLVVLPGGWRFQHYMNSTTFYIDALCLLPLDFLYLSLGFKSILRIFRLVKVYQVRSLTQFSCFFFSKKIELPGWPINDPHPQWYCCPMFFQGRAV